MRAPRAGMTALKAPPAAGPLRARGLDSASPHTRSASSRRTDRTAVSVRRGELLAFFVPLTPQCPSGSPLEGLHGDTELYSLDRSGAS